MKRLQKSLIQEAWFERVEKLPILAKVEARILSNRTDVQIPREELIEKLGAHMCDGAIRGPTNKEIRAFRHLCRIEKKNQRDLADLPSMPLMKRLIYPDIADKF